jgi:lipoprotein-anchoring transpeptidase ErfK/SrfK
MRHTSDAAMKQKTKQKYPVYINYHSYRRPSPNKPSSSHSSHSKKIFGFVIVAVVVAVGVIGLIKIEQKDATKKVAVENRVTTLQTKSTLTEAQSASNQCASNTDSQLILVSISQRHLWACNKNVQAYDSPVITGDLNVPADVTPVGTYYIYDKQTDLYLNGSDSRGSWHDWVYYWMPFLSNQYGVFGLHDATWRTSSDFGNISPSSNQSSHGCVELPLATAAWLYNWSSVGTAVTIES